jgi:hypothetical protein
MSGKSLDDESWFDTMTLDSPDGDETSKADRSTLRGRGPKPKEI